MVEMIVAAVIVAIIAIAAITIYSGLIQESRRQTVDTLTQTGAAAANAYLRKTGNDPTVAQLHLYYDATKYAVTIVPANNQIVVTDLKHTEISDTAQY